MSRRKLISAGVVQLDPEDCGSTISYYIGRGRHELRAEITLTDCNRVITWYFDGNRQDKIERACKILADFREAYLKAAKRNRKTKK